MRAFDKNRDWLLLLVWLLMIVTVVFWADRPITLAFLEIDRQAPRLVVYANAITTLGDSKWYLWSSGLLALSAGGLWFWQRSTKAGQLALRAGWIFTNIAVSGILVNILKFAFGRSRPILLEREDIFNAFVPLMAKAAWRSFPSGHTTTAIALTLSLIILLPRWRWPLLLAGAMIASTRVITVAHYTGDILAGTLVGSLTVCGMLMLYQRLGLDKSL